MTRAGASARDRKGRAQSRAPWLCRLALLTHRHPWHVLVLALVITGLSLISASRITLNADLAALLPRSFASVQALERLEDRSGATGLIVVVVDGAAPETLRRYADTLAPRLEALAAIHHVDVQRPRQWIRDNALQLADPERLETFAEQIEARVDWEIQRHNPLFFDLEDDGPPSIELPKASGAHGQWLEQQLTSDYYEDLDSGRLVVLARPYAEAKDFNVAAQAVADVQRAVTQLNASFAKSGLRTALTGRYKKQVDQKLQIARDLKLSSLIALILVLAYLALHFRRLSVVFQLGLPLILGLVATFGIVGVTFGELNILTAFIGAILLGLGIDHGIHLQASFDEQRGRGLSTRSAIVRTFSLTGRAVGIAALTTVSGFLGLSLSEFQTFSQFGIVAAIGMVAIVTAYACCLPPLLRLSDGRHYPLPTVPRGRLSGRKWPQLLAASAALLVSLWLSPRIGFDSDFSALQDARLPSFELDHEVNRLLGHSQTPTVVLTDSLEEQRQVSARLRSGSTARAAATTIDMVASVSDVIDPHPARRAALIKRIRAAAERVRPAWLTTDKDKTAREQLLRMTAQPPLTAATVPDEVLRQLGVSTRAQATPPTRHASAGPVLVFPSISLSRGDDVLRFASELKAGAFDKPMAGEAMILADILETVQRESGRVLIATLLGVGGALWLLQRTLGATAVALLSASLSVGSTLGVAAAIGLRLNYLNMVVIPVLFGVAVDGAVHLVQHQRHGASGTLTATRAIRASLLTTALGFGALLLADHPGLRGLGTLALLGFACNALVSLVWLPALLAVARRGGSSRHWPVPVG